MGFDMFVLFGLFLRILVVGLGLIISIRIIGIKNIFFIKKYIQKSFFSIEKIFYWFIVFISIIYFEYLIQNSEKILFSDVVKENFFLSMLVVLLLLGVIFYALRESMTSVTEAENIRKKLIKAQRIKKGIKAVSIVSQFTPVSIFAKLGLLGASTLFDNYINNQVSNEVSYTIRKTLKGMILIAFINLIMILISTYLITGQIIFW